MRVGLASGLTTEATEQAGELAAEEVASHRRILERASDYVRSLPPGMFADDDLCRAALRLCMALVDAVHSGHGRGER